MQDRWTRRPSGLWTPEGIYTPAMFLQGAQSRRLGVFRTKAGVSSEVGAGVGVKASSGAYYENSSSTSETEDYAGVYHFSPPITTHPAGNVTKLEVWTRAASGTIRMGLYNPTTRGRLDAGSNQVNMANGGFASVTLAASVAVTLNQSVVVGWQASATAYFYTSGDNGKYESNTYTDFPVATLSEWAGDGTGYRVRIWLA